MVVLRSVLLLGAVALASVMLRAHAAGTEADCRALAKLALPATSIEVAQVNSQGSFAPESADTSVITGLPAFCRIAGTIEPEIGFEVWLPLQWNGKLLTTAGGGFVGTIGYRALGEGLTRGYAAVSTDQGHQQDAQATGDRGAEWAFRNKDRIESFAWRGIHEATVRSKEIIAAFYSTQPRQSYLRGCSSGGRAALVSASRFPQDYDGIIAGAPSDKTMHIWSRLMQAGKAIYKDDASRVTPEQLPILRQAILASCDANDGIRDGVVDDPRHCGFDVGSLQCKGSATSGCFRAEQIVALRAAYAPLRDAAGAVLVPGLPSGIDLSAGLDRAFFGGPSPWPIAVGFFKYFVYDDAAWDFRSYDPVASTQLADKKFASMMNATTDLSGFRARNGRLIMYHGWSDAGIPAQNSIDYYEAVTRSVPRNDNVRLFMVPGMGHCGGGEGPNDFDLLPALEQWVEKDVAPERVVARKVDPSSKSIERTRPLCAYPQTAVYKGSGSTDDERNFGCAGPAALNVRSRSSAAAP